MCGTFSLLPAASCIASAGNRRTLPGNRPKPAQSPSSLCANKACMPRQMPRKGLLAAACLTTSVKPRAASSRMQSGIAPTPGNTTRVAAAMTAGSDVTAIFASGATCSNAFDTDSRLPMP